MKDAKSTVAVQDVTQKSLKATKEQVIALNNLIILAISLSKR